MESCVITDKQNELTGKKYFFIFILFNWQHEGSATKKKKQKKKGKKARNSLTAELFLRTMSLMTIDRSSSFSWKTETKTKKRRMVSESKTGSYILTAATSAACKPRDLVTSNRS